jgi:hypothetical protein
MMTVTWEEIGRAQPQTLTEARLQLHYAIQFIAATGAALAEPLPDYSHTSLVWDPTLEVFVGAPIRAAQPFRVALDPITLTAVLVDRQGDTLASFPLHSRTLAEGLQWHQAEVTCLGADGSTVELLSYPADFPEHGLARGATFDASQAEAERQELSYYYANTDRLLQGIVDAADDASPVCIWPHHFDMATLISLPGYQQGEPTTIGIGLSPGDSSYNEPYWYVSPYPYPSLEVLPPLDGKGVWHTQHWVGAVLTASQLTGKSAQAQAEQVRQFLRSAEQVSTALLQG